MEINVNTASWHYKLWEFCARYGNARSYYSTGFRPRTLCAYFWGVIWALPKLALKWCVLTIVYFLGLNDDSPSGDIYIKHKAAFWTTTYASFVMFSLAFPYMVAFDVPDFYLAALALGTVVIYILSFWSVGVKIREKVDERTPEKQGEGFITLTWKMVKSAKRRVCPFIEYNET